MSSSAARTDSLTKVSSLSALQSAAFRLYFAGQLVSVSGTWMQAIAQQVVVYDLTKSELTLGLVACAQGIPSLFLSPFGGVIVEQFSRRKIIIVTQSVMMGLAFILAALQFTNSLQVWHVIALSLGIGFANAVDAPARQSFVVEMVGKENLPSGIMLNAVMFNSARIIGPALGGIALKAVGPSWCFFLNGASFLAVLISLILMVVPFESLKPKGPIHFIQPLREGLEFARHHPTIRYLLMLSAVSSIFGMNYTVLVPAFADHILHDTELGTAALMTAQGAGAVIAGIIVARANGSGIRGRVMTVGAIVAPIMVILLTFTRSFYTALPVAGVAGLSFICQFILMNTLIQTQVPDEFRGRVLSLYTLTFMGFNPFGSLAIGVIAEWIGTLPAIALYGSATLLGVGVILWRAPQVRQLR
ncbi:MAG: MFS transporter [Anaerolineae bacterium]|nr:MFS transporter [Anaerolineae bacterium]